MGHRPMLGPFIPSDRCQVSCRQGPFVRPAGEGLELASCARGRYEFGAVQVAGRGRLAPAMATASMGQLNLMRNRGRVNLLRTF